MGKKRDNDFGDIGGLKYGPTCVVCFRLVPAQPDLPHVSCYGIGHLGSYKRVHLGQERNQPTGSQSRSVYNTTHNIRESKGHDSYVCRQEYGGYNT